MKLKQKASAKIHRRYLLISGVDKKGVEKAILDYVGILGWASATPVFVSDKNFENEKIILAVERKSLQNIRASLEMYNEKVKILRVSGTLKGLIK
jgi:RNase P/RNase MRP subunit POP5